MIQQPIYPYLTLLLLSLSGLLWPNLIQASVAHFATPTTTLAIPVTSWVQQRDAGIVKQELDHSCGAASLATILNEYYGQSVTEAELLETMDKGDLRASFADMAAALPHYGFRGIGLAASYEQLSQLTAPVIAYLHYRDNDHFSVIRGIDEHTVWLADPAMGNRTYSREQFLQMWATREDATYPGRLLAILPLEHTVSSNPAYFSNQPRRQTAGALNLPTLQPLR